MPTTHRKPTASAVLLFAFMTAGFAAPPAAIACPQPQGIGPLATSAATQPESTALDAGTSVGFGHNSAWYEFNPTIGAFVRVYSWYDPVSDATPVQPDEIDVTNDPELGIRSTTGLATSVQSHSEESLSCDRGTPMPATTVTGVTYGRGGLVGFSWRAIMGAYGGGPRAAMKPQLSEQVVTFSGNDCDRHMNERDACTIVRGHLSGLLGPGNSIINPAHNYLNLNPMHAKLSTWLVPTVAKLAPRRESNCASRR